MSVDIFIKRCIHQSTMWREGCVKTRLSIGHSEQLGYHLKSVDVGAMFPQWKATSSPQIRARAWLSEALIFCHTIALLIPWETHMESTYSSHRHPYLSPLTRLDSMLYPLQPLSTSCPLLTLAYNLLVWFCCPFVNTNRAIMEHSQSTRVHTHKTTHSPRAVGSFLVQSWWGLVFFSHSMLGWWRVTLYRQPHLLWVPECGSPWS